MPTSRATTTISSSISARKRSGPTERCRARGWYSAGPVDRPGPERDRSLHRQQRRGRSRHRSSRSAAAADTVTRAASRISVLSCAAAALAVAQLGCSGSNGPPSMSRVIGDGGTPSGMCLAAPGSRPDGWPCGCTADCVSGATCQSEAGSGSPGGNCTRVCIFGGPTVCSAGAVCQDFGISTGQSLCAARCATNADCPPHRYCDSDGACLAFCFGDSDCDSNHCDTYQNICTATAQTSTGDGVSARCAIDSDCRSRNCGSGGLCATSCSISDGRCPEGGVCVQSSSDVQLDLAFCFPACTAGGHCADPTFACSATGVPQDEVACFPSINSAKCMGPAPVPNSDGLACGCGNDCSYGSGCLSESSTGIPKGSAHGGVLRRPARRAVPGTPASKASAFGFAASTPTAARPDEICTAQHECLPLCSSNADCAGDLCDPYTGYCQATAATGLPMGAACGADDDCKSGECSPAGNFCSAPCRVSSSICPDGTVCAPGTASSSSDYGACAPPCASPAECAPFGLTCVATAGAPTGTSMHCE